MFQVKCKGCLAKDEQISDLRDQIEWLRIQLGTPLLTKTSAQPRPEKLYTSDDEDDIEHMLHAGMLPVHAAEAALQHIGAMNTDVHFDID